MPYHQSAPLASLFDEQAQAIVKQTAREIADDVGREMTAATKRHTPVRTGRTRDSFDQSPTRHEPPDRYVSGVESHDFRARLVEHGVKPHDLKPKDPDGALATPEGPRAGAHHPGHGGAHMVAQAAAEVDARLARIAQQKLDRMARRIERLADQ